MFAHGGIKPPPDLTKTSLCKRWKEGMCHLSPDKCPFAHGKRELRQTPLFRLTPSGNKEYDEAPGQMMPPMPLQTPITRRSPPAMSPPGVDVPMPSMFQHQGFDFMDPAQFAGGYCEQFSDKKSSNKIGSVNPLEPAAMMPMKVTTSPFFDNCGGDPFMSASPHLFSLPFPGNDPWEGETRAGESSSEDGGSNSTSSPEVQEPTSADASPTDQQESLFAYSAFSGLPHLLLQM